MGQFLQDGKKVQTLSKNFFWHSSLAHLEPKLQLFEVDDHGDAGNDDLSHHHLQNFKQS